MGNTVSEPSGNNYIISYCKHLKYTPKETTMDSNLNMSITGNHKTQIDMIYNVFYTKIKNAGYSLKEEYLHPRVPNSQLCEIIKGITDKGFYSSNREKKLSDLIIEPKCYSPKIKYVRSLIYEGNVLIAGVVMDAPFLKNVLKCDDSEIITDILLIVGYTASDIIIRGIWNPEAIIIPNEYFYIFKEMWNIEISSPEEIYLFE
jgi:hypothetical protein